MIAKLSQMVAKQAVPMYNKKRWKVLLFALSRHMIVRRKGTSAARKKANPWRCPPIAAVDCVKWHEVAKSAAAKMKGKGLYP